jgi:tRNA-modifying protein YgfZ
MQDGTQGCRAVPIASLPQRTCLTLGGLDAEPFLDGLITSSLPGEGEVCGSALLSPQGKLLFTFLVSRTGQGFRLECDARERDDLIRRLLLYKLRAKVEITAEDMPVQAAWGEEAASGLSASGLSDRRHGQMGTRHYGAMQVEAAHADYAAHRLTLGVLEGPQEIIAGQDFPHDVALDLTGAVSFSKGCYVGQEVVSRVKHRGTARRRPVLLHGLHSPLEAGEALSSGGREIGTLRLAVGAAGLGVVRIDQISKAEGVMLAGRPVALSLPPYATYRLSPLEDEG